MTSPPAGGAVTTTQQKTCLSDLRQRHDDAAKQQRWEACLSGEALCNAKWHQRSPTARRVGVTRAQTRRQQLPPHVHSNRAESSGCCRS